MKIKTVGDFLTTSVKDICGQAKKTLIILRLRSGLSLKDQTEDLICC